MYNWYNLLHIFNEFNLVEAYFMDTEMLPQCGTTPRFSRCQMTKNAKELYPDKICTDIIDTDSLSKSGVQIINQMFQVRYGIPYQAT